MWFYLWPPRNIGDHVSVYTRWVKTTPTQSITWIDYRATVGKLTLEVRPKTPDPRGRPQPVWPDPTPLQPPPVGRRAGAGDPTSADGVEAFAAWPITLRIGSLHAVPAICPAQITDRFATAALQSHCPRVLRRPK